MPQAIHAESEAINADSFLDIVASVVSIMIIMVLMVGLRIKNGPAELPPDHPAARASVDLAAAAATEQSLRKDVLKTAGEIQQVQQELMIRQRHRDVLALAVLTMEQAVETPHAQGNEPAAQNTDLLQGLSDAKIQLDQLARQGTVVEKTPAKVVQLASYPTPISQTVDGTESNSASRRPPGPDSHGATPQEADRGRETPILQTPRPKRVHRNGRSHRRVLPTLHAATTQLDGEEIRERQAAGYTGSLKKTS